MATHYIENEDNDNPYYFDQESQNAGKTTTVTTVSSSDFSSYPASGSGAHIKTQQVRTTYDDDDAYQWAQQQPHQSVAGFNKIVSQQQYPTSTSPTPQVRATVRQVTTQEQHHGSSGQYHSPQPQNRLVQTYTTSDRSISPQSSQVTTQYHFDNRQTTQSPGAQVYYQSPSSVHQSNYDHDSRTDSSSRPRDQHGQASQVSVRSTSSNMHQHHDNGMQYNQPQYSPQQASPQHQQYQYHDQLQQYYSQLTPEQYQQLMRQQQLQRQQQQQQDRQRVEYQQTVVTSHARPNQDGQQYEEYQQRRVYQTSPNQDQHYRQPGQDQYDSYHQRSVQVQGSVPMSSNQDSYRQQLPQHYPDQHTQLDAYYEQQHRAVPQQASPTPHYTQEQYHHTTVSNVGGQAYPAATPATSQQQQQQQQRQDEQDYYAAQLIRQQQEREHAAQVEAAQRQQAAQQAHQEVQQIIQVDQPTKPVGIRGLMNKFTGPTVIPTYQPKSNLSKSENYTISSYKTSSGPGQTTTHTKSYHTVTYSSLPQTTEPPVNSAAYYESLEREGNTHASTYNQSGAPQHIQGPAPGFGALRDRFKLSSSETNDNGQDQRRFYIGNSGNSSLAMLRDQYVNRAQETAQPQNDSFSQRIQTVTRTVVTETHHNTTHQTPAEPAPQETPADPTPQEAPVQQQEEIQTQSQGADDQAVSSEAAVADGNSLSGASSLDHDTTINNDAETTVVSS